MNSSVIAQKTNYPILLSGSVNQRTKIKTSILGSFHNQFFTTSAVLPVSIPILTSIILEARIPEMQCIRLSFPDIICELLSLNYYRKIRKEDNLLSRLPTKAVPLW